MSEEMTPNAITKAIEALQQSADYLNRLPVDLAYTSEAPQFAAQNRAALLALRTQNPSAERETLQLIDQRDAAEECVSDIYYKVTGNSPEWSNLFGFEQALEEIGDAVDALKLAAKAALSTREGDNNQPEKGVPSMTEDQIEYMTNRFLGWKLPEDFRPDAGISFKRTHSETGPCGPQNYEPSGTNLFDYMQAKEMIRYMIDGLPAALREREGEK